MQLKCEITRKTFDIALHCLIQRLRRHAVDLRKIRVEHYSLASHNQDP